MRSKYRRHLPPRGEQHEQLGLGAAPAAEGAVRAVNERALERGHGLGPAGAWLRGLYLAAHDEVSDGQLGRGVAEVEGELVLEVLGVHGVSLRVGGTHVRARSSTLGGQGFPPPW